MLVQDSSLQRVGVGVLPCPGWQGLECSWYHLAPLDLWVGQLESRREGMA